MVLHPRHLNFLGIRRSRFSEHPTTEPSESVNLSNDQIKQMMLNAQRQIEERKRQLTESTPQVKPSIEGVDNKARIAQLTAQIQARMANRPNLEALQQNSESKSAKPAPLILNSEGRTVDVTGKEVQLIQRMPTLKANIRAQKREQFVKISSEKTQEKEDSSFFDGRVDAKNAVRPKRNFKFVEKGTYEALGHRVRSKAKLEKLETEIAHAAKKTGISSAARLAILSTIEPIKKEKSDEIPEVEWWDSFVMKDATYRDSVSNKKQSVDKYDGITHLIEHPIQMKPPAEPVKPIPLPVFLTKREKKKLRRQNRREAWKEKQEKIRLGLDAPPEPKVKMSNMMRVLGSQAVQDPTKIEAHVREQMAKRQKAHEQANASRKLTVEQKRQKKVKKVKEDTSLGVSVAVYRILNLSNPAKKFKIEKNAKDLTMTGVVVIYKNVNVIVVEGGPKQERKFKKLMLQRIKWSEDDATAIKSTDEKTGPNKCFLVWEGTAKSRTFGEIKFKISPNESFARELFKNHSVEHYWDLAFRSAYTSDI